MGSEYSFDQMAKKIKDIGKMGNKIEKEKYIFLKMINGINIYGKIGKKFHRFYFINKFNIFIIFFLIIMLYIFF